ncbi:uncharacterized protein N7496_001593 [Penicillium cataractarum]|uniref:Ig-like domain-containing protein n=1 Tax=Penicillium cataractarum TaxID=2100454 RepID=A0A9W9VWH8_9EURO|nr:uncharacterized protein N7496_001593 [Penicillium cataractarum]KAJ5390525.1 hypothetical protein N7496_001593 [Penicillium cataractarum]
MGIMLHHLVLLLLAAVWPAFAFPRAAFNRRIRSVGGTSIHARANGVTDDIPNMEGFNITLSPSKWQAILVSSFDRQATATLTTTLTISDYETAFTIKPSDTAVDAATFTGTTSGYTLTSICYPTLATVAGSTQTKCIKDTVTTLGVIDIGLVAVTPNPTGFAVGTQTLTPGGEVTVGTHTLSLGPSGGLIIDGSSTHIDSPSTTTTILGSTTIPSQTPKQTPTSRTKIQSTPTSTSTSTHTTSSRTSTKPSTNPTTKITTTSKKPSVTSTKPSNTSIKPTTTSAKPTITSTKPITPTSHSTPQSSHTDEILTIGTLTVTADPSGFQVGSTTLTPGGMITVGTQTVSLETGGGGVIVGGATIPLTTTSSTSSQSWTTLSDASTTGLYGIVTLPDFETLTTPTIITTEYIVSSTQTTTGPIYVGTGGIVLQSWPPSTDDDHIGTSGGIIIPDPIRPSISTPTLKCPAILAWLCGSDHTSTTDDGSDVDPDDKPNSNPADDPNKDDNPTTEPTSTHTSTTSTTSKTSSTSTTSTSTCTKTQTVTDCGVTCSPTVVSGQSTTTTTCFTTSCSTVEGCSATGTTSTTTITSEACGTGTASSACPTFTDGPGWVYPDTTIDTAAVNSLASSIMSADASLLAAFSSALASSTPTTMATTTSTTHSSAVTRTTSHTAPSTTKTTSQTTKTSTSSKSKTTSATTTSALTCINQYDSETDEDSCYCEGHTGSYQTMSSTSGMTNYQPCAWTTLPPLYTDVNVGPITSTLSDGDVVYCTSAHWAEDGGSSKYCLGSVSTISTASHTSTTTSKSSTTSSGVSATGTGKPTGEIYIGIVTEGYTFTWNVYIPGVIGTIPDWCDDSNGTMTASGDTTRYYYPPDIKFQDLNGKASELPCVYTGDKDTVGTLGCEGVGTVPCTSDFAESDASPICYNSVLYAGSAFPRVYCKWYGSDGDA